MFQMAEYNEGTSKEGGVVVRGSDDTEVPNNLKPFL